MTRSLVLALVLLLWHHARGVGQALPGEWQLLGSGISAEPYHPGTVEALTVYDGRLIAGGEFITAGDVQAVCVAAWDGAAWTALGPGFLDTSMNDVNALTVWNGLLIAGGTFSAIGGVPASNIAAWNGSTWQPLGSGVDGHVLTLGVYNGQLIAAGNFGTAGEVSANHIAAWNGTAWSPLGAGLETYVLAMAVYGGRLILAGTFQSAGGTSVRNIAAWDGVHWAPVGFGTNGCVNAMTVFDNQLVVGGCFDEAGGIEAWWLAAWDGSSWHPFGSGKWTDYFWGDVWALAVHGGTLVIGGNFNSASPLCNNIVAWDGASWLTMGEGLAGYTSAMTNYQNNLIVGGRFDAAAMSWQSDWISAHNIVAWGDVTTDVDQESMDAPGVRTSLSQSHPNPFNSETAICFNLERDSRVRLEVFDILGHCVRTLVDEWRAAGAYQATWDGTDANGKPAASGMYFYRLTADTFTESRKMILLK